ENLIERIQFGINKSFAKDEDEWWNTVLRSAKAHDIDFSKKGITINAFKDALKSADETFIDTNFQKLHDINVSSQWDYLHGQVISKYAGKSVSIGPQPYENFSNQALGNEGTRDFLVKRTAQRLGVNITDATGNGINTNEL